MNSAVNQPDERRQFLRFAFQAPAQISLPGQDCPARLLDVSLKGALVERVGDWSVPVGQACRLRLELAPGAVIVMGATVVHVDGAHFGLRCDQIDLDSVTHLRHMVELNAGDLALLERELGKLAGWA